jgi:hypothetical protein
LKIGENGVTEDLMVFPTVNKLSLDIGQMQPITLTILIDEKSPEHIHNVYQKVLKN